MAQSKHQIEALLAGVRPRHQFGQNFMIDQNLVRIVAEAGELSASDWVIEVGPGTGTLTEELLERAGAVLAVEIDRDLAAMLRDRLGGNSKFTLIEGDALAGKHAVNAEIIPLLEAVRNAGHIPKLVANLPYNIASPLVIELLIAGVELLAFTVQKEVGDRLRAGAGSEAYGPLSVVAQMLSSVEMLRTLPPQAFWPAPKIESGLVRMRRQNRLGDRAGAFSTFVHKVFSFRRKTLKRALAQAGVSDPDALLQRAELNGQQRPEVLTPEQFHRLFERSEAEAFQEGEGSGAGPDIVKG